MIVISGDTYVGVDSDSSLSWLL